MSQNQGNFGFLQTPPDQSAASETVGRTEDRRCWHQSPGGWGLGGLVALPCPPRHSQGRKPHSGRGAARQGTSLDSAATAEPLQRAVASNIPLPCQGVTCGSVPPCDLTFLRDRFPLGASV